MDSTLFYSNMRSRWGCKQVYLCESETSPNQLDLLGMESPLSGECSSWQLIGCPVEQARNVNGLKRPPEEESAHPCRVFPRSGSKTTDNEKSLGTRTGLCVRVRNISKSAGPSGDGVSTLWSRKLIGCLVEPGMWMARSDLRCFWLQRRSWRASCDMRWECRTPYRLMYATVAVLSVRTSTCSPCKRPLRRFKARSTASKL